MEGVELVVKSPGVPAASPLAAVARARGIPIWSEVELGYRLLDGQPVDRGHRDEREDDDDGAARRDPARRGPPSRGRRKHRAAAHRGRRGDRARRVGRLRALELPARGRHTTLTCDVAVLLNLEPDHLDRHGTFEAYRDAKLRIFERARRQDRAARDGARRASSSRPTIRCRPSRASPECTTGRTQPPRRRPRARRASATTRSPKALRTFAGVPHRLELVRELRGRSLCQRLEGDEHRRSEPRRGRLRRAAAAHPRRLAQGRGLRPVRARAARERALDLSHRRGVGRARRCTRCSRAAVLARRRSRSERSRTRARTRRPATSCCSRPRQRASTSSTTSSSAAIRSGGSSRSSHESSQEAALARVAAPRVDSARAHRVRPRDGLQRDVLIGGARQRQPGRLSRAPGRLRVHRHHADDLRGAHRFPQAARARTRPRGRCARRSVSRCS